MLHKLQDIKDKRVLISPLNWGLGHVTRIVPVINHLLDLKNEVLICCNSDQEEFLRQFFPSLWYIPHDGYPFKFKGKGEFEKDIFRSYFNLKKRLSKELKEVQLYVDKFTPDVLISDQRYGFRNKKVKSIFITHQINLPVKGIARFAQLQNRWMIDCFDEVWVADDLMNSLAGQLSKTKRTDAKFIGSLSRFESSESAADTEKYKYLGIISGPQPYSDHFFEDVLNKFSKVDGKTAIVVGHKMKEEKYSILRNCDVIIQPSFIQLQRLLAQSDKIVSRCGYSTLMDLNELGKEAVLIGTKGQAEQEYLVELHQNHPKWTTLTEEEFKHFSL